MTGLPSPPDHVLVLEKKDQNRPLLLHMYSLANLLLHCKTPRAVRYLPLSAGHNGCLQCMASARHSKQECPLCRAPFPKEVQLVSDLLVKLGPSCFVIRSPAQVMRAARQGLQSAGSMTVLADKHVEREVWLLLAASGMPLNCTLCSAGCESRAAGSGDPGSCAAHR